MSSILLISNLSGCARKKGSQQLPDSLVSVAQIDTTVLGQTIITGQTISTADKGNPVEIVIGFPYTSAIGEECFDAKVYYQSQSMPQARAVCRRNGAWILLPEILMPVPYYNLSVHPAK